MEIEINPFVDLVGQPVPPVDPQAIKNGWNSAFELFARYPMPETKEASRLELFALSYRMQVLLAILKGIKPDESAIQTIAVLPLAWPNSDYEDRLIRTELTRAPFWHSTARRLLEKLIGLAFRFSKR